MDEMINILMVDDQPGKLLTHEELAEELAGGKQVIKPGEQKSLTTDRVILIQGPRKELMGVRAMFSMAAEGKGPSAIARELRDTSKTSVWVPGGCLESGPFRCRGFLPRHEHQGVLFTMPPKKQDLGGGRNSSSIPRAHIAAWSPRRRRRSGDRERLKH